MGREGRHPICVLWADTFSRRKETFLMFFGSSQAISLLRHLPISSFSALQKSRITKHRFCWCPAVTPDYTEQYQTPSMPCTVLWCAVPMRCGEHLSTECYQHTPWFVAGIKWGRGVRGLVPCSALAEASGNHWRGGNSHVAWQTSGLSEWLGSKLVLLSAF